VIDRLLTLDAELVRREAGDPLDPDAELVDVIAGTTRCELQQVAAGDAHDGRVQQTGWRVFLPAAVELDGVDAIRIDGELLELDGDPWPVRHPRTGAVHHVEAAVRRVH
jgi:hypothetical protein